ALLTSPIGEEIFRKSEDIDTIYSVANPVLPRLCNLIGRMALQKYDTALIFHASQRPILPFCKFLNIPNIIATENHCKGLDDLLTIAVVDKHHHEIERRLDIVRAVTPIKSDSLLTFELSDDEKLKSTKPFAVIHPGAQDKFKQWHPRHFITVGKHLAKLGLNVIVTGGNNECEIVTEIANAIPNAKNSAGKLSLRSLAAHIDAAKLIVTNDTGPMHLGFAMNTPTFAVFTPTDPRICGPHKAKNAEIFKAEITCLPCLKKRCRQPFCMEQISPSRIIEAIDRIGQNGWSL
ncbi:MAG: glycosyltransferase family 9 protein, partial [Simkaniaceae bacterium]|nr:glycosyltransferase family 9 protein [Simkaniaceae bacterium]